MRLRGRSSPPRTRRLRRIQSNPCCPRPRSWRAGIPSWSRGSATRRRSCRRRPPGNAPRVRQINAGGGGDGATGCGAVGELAGSCAQRGVALRVPLQPFATMTMPFRRAPLGVLLVLSGCLATALVPAGRARTGGGPAPPVARKEPKVDIVHGHRLLDDYFWLRRKDSPEV